MGRIGTAHKAEEQSRACPTDQNRQHSAEGTSPRHTLRKHPHFAEEDKGQGTFQRDDRLLALHALSVLWQRHCRGADCGGESVRCRSSVSRRGSTKDHVDNDNKLYYVTKDFHAAHHVNFALNFKHGLQAPRHQLTQLTQVPANVVPSSRTFPTSNIICVSLHPKCNMFTIFTSSVWCFGCVILALNTVY